MLGTKVDSPSAIQEEHEAACQGVVFQVQTEELGSHQEINCRHQTSQNRSEPTNHTSKHQEGITLSWMHSQPWGHQPLLVSFLF
jgi:hypothetical protein